LEFETGLPGSISEKELFHRSLAGAAINDTEINGYAVIGENSNFESQRLSIMQIVRRLLSSYAAPPFAFVLQPIRINGHFCEGWLDGVHDRRHLLRCQLGTIDAIVILISSGQVLSMSRTC